MRLARSAYAICVCAEGSLRDIYLRVCAAVSNVSQTHSLNAILIRIHSLLKMLEFCSLLSYTYVHI